MAKKRRKGRGRKHSSKSRSRARKGSRRSRRGKGIRKYGGLVKAFWRKHRAAIMKHAPKKRFKYVWSRIKKGKC